jgi:hypothetical protein
MQLFTTRNGKITVYNLSDGKVDIFATLVNRHPNITFGLLVAVALITKYLLDTYL